MVRQMRKAHEYRYRAASLRLAADKATHPAAREQLRTAAHDYERMAEELEQRFICCTQG
jgi:hypothetical protein